VEILAQIERAGRSWIRLAVRRMSGSSELFVDRPWWPLLSVTQRTTVNKLASNGQSHIFSAWRGAEVSKSDADRFFSQVTVLCSETRYLVERCTDGVRC
jgi:hypothetical protein